MTACKIQRGVFALRACGNEALMVCQSCNRPACGEHVAQSSPPECTECAARRREQEQQRQATQTGVRRVDDDFWSTSYRFYLWDTIHDTPYTYSGERDEHDDDRGVGEAVSEGGAGFGDDVSDSDFGGDDDGGFGDS